MNCFELLREVLDNAYALIPGDEAAKDATVARELERLSHEYQDLTVAKEIDYGNPVTRFAYVYAYVACHANLVYQLVREHEELRSIFATERAQISCIGGGPGSDLVGVLKYLELVGAHLTLIANIFDREPAWGETYAELFEKVDSGVRVVPSFQSFDVRDQSEWRKWTKYLASDLFTMVFFVSEVFAFSNDAEPFFSHVFAQAKRGAYFLFIDNQKANGTRAFAEWFDSLAAANGLATVHSGEGRMLPPLDEDKSALGKYYEKYRDPRIVAWVAWRIARKQ
jgi:hypothetical protein